ncbi:MAG: hypothetical protein A3B91_01865 [Candidatus Yanofskybacteria bacterium RIFCSPHIGHO2_02_FULL_41_29]|uniref:Transcriptional regulator n=1 Tax=Candidatus Yanofskybacteria bacterium RIFCSPHIGHO2_01_FULL_41_53 TaxID=1802663 RepID=A0A1F8EH32_9BACT|nr:MAG: hypothetical protein A2650_04305 [Candidatus Yanofskybacteria bacterium RIFCSPHIGHO2_01_FULL_41_53]OGN11207.1 MAG: hypothetical protein A3B91_01865 [Candidatus Yanofskybacteria bacterium RIFCSPHIGHO2_02_FULL_41_29]OGN16954.1 MAG: hypothetical protein A3F48_00860 [Candidatus Yanofskybacteria bacterium RIFCSPHIGHO2_12_FULL_41_9]OGN22273.1 MAG: hypothetical protein A2916_04110 [Candidatus Yanofskybacteria bacterium RIFCSPLOWO2_01_FULL_41_67]OGN29641.1 MAG: hypothetical protein A3H54_00750 
MNKANLKNRLIRRLRIIGGQVRGIERMVEQDEYCVDIITQSLAIKEALSSIENIILEKHLSTHVVKQMKSNRAEKAIREILKIHRLSKRK